MIITFNPNLQFVETEESAVLYDALHGNNLKINKDSLKIIKLLRSGESIESIQSKYDVPKLDLLIQKLSEKNFILPHTDSACCEKKCNHHLNEELVREGKLARHLRLNVTEKCNLDCGYCYERCSNVYGQKRMMTWKIAEKAIQSFFNNAEKNELQHVSIRFFGGEPLLNWEVVEKSLMYIEENKGPIHVNYILNTNGTLLNGHIAEILARYKVSIALSLDGVREYHDQTRIYPNGKGSFDKIDENIKYLVQAGCIFNFSVVCTDINYPHLRELIDYLRDKQLELGYKLPVNFNNIQICDREGIVNLSTEKKAEYLIDAIRYAHEQGVYCYGGLTHFVFDKFINKSVGQHCGGVGSELSVDPVGNVFPCSGIDIQLGNIDQMEKIFESDEYLLLVNRQAGSIEACRGCMIEGYCAGGCFAEYLSNQGKESQTYRDCDLQKLVFTNLIKEYILTE